MLIVSEIKVSTDPSRHHWIDFKIKNIGKTPAILMQYAASAEVCDVLPDQPSYGPSFVDAGIVLGHGDHIERSVRTKSSDRLRKGFTAYRVYFWGYFACEDMFGQRLEIGYAYTATAFAPLIRSEQTDRMAWVRVGGDAYNYNRRKKAS